MMGKLQAALEIAGAASRIAGAIVDAVRKGDVRRVDAILSGPLKTSLALTEERLAAAAELDGDG